MVCMEYTIYKYITYYCVVYHIEKTIHFTWCENLATTDANVAGPACDILWDNSARSLLEQSQV